MHKKKSYDGWILVGKTIKDHHDVYYNEDQRVFAEEVIYTYLVRLDKSKKFSIMNGKNNIKGGGEYGRKRKEI